MNSRQRVIIIQPGRWPGVIVITLLLVLVTVVLGLQGIDTHTITVERALTWSICLVVFVLGELFSGQAARKFRLGYMTLAMFAAWLILGLLAALLLVWIGCFVVWRIRASPLWVEPFAYDPGERVVARLTLFGSALLVAAAVYALLDGPIPMTGAAKEIGQAAVAFLSSTVAAQFIDAYLTQRRQIIPVPAANKQIFDFLFRQIVLFALCAGLVVAHDAAGVLVFAVFMALAASQSMYQSLAQHAEDDLRNRVQELSLFNAKARTISATLVLDDVMRSVYGWVRERAAPHAFYIALCDEYAALVEFPLVVVNDTPQVGETVPVLDEPVIKAIHKSRQALYLDSMKPDPAFQCSMDKFACQDDYASYAGFPLIAGDKFLGVMGVFCCGGRDAQHTLQQETLASIATQAGLAIGNAVLYRQSVWLARNLDRINQSMRDVVFNMNDDAAMETACVAALSISGANKSAIFLMKEYRQPRLVKCVGLTDAHRAFYDDPEYCPPMPGREPRTFTDIHAQDDPIIRALGQAGDFRATAEIALKSGASSVGLLVVYHNRPHHYSPTELELLETLAYQVAVTLDNATLVEALETYASEQAQLVQLSRISTASLDVHTVVRNVLEVLPTMITVDAVYIGLLSTGREQISFYQGNGKVFHTAFTDDLPEVLAFIRQAHPIPRIYHVGEGIISEGLGAVLADSALAGDALAGDALAGDALDALAGDALAILALVPLIIDQRFLGVIVLTRQDAKEWEDHEWRRLEMAANQIAAQLHNAQHYRDTQDALNRRLQQLGLIENIARQITSALDLDDLIRNVLEAAIQSSQADVAALGLRTSLGMMSVRVVEHVNGSWNNTSLERDNRLGLMGRVLRTGETLLVSDNRVMPEYLSDLVEHPYLSSMVVPLIQEDVVIGVLDVESTQIDFFREEHITFVKNLAGHAVLSIQNARLLQEHQSQIETLILLRDLSLQLSSATDIHYVVDAVLQAARGILQGQGAAFYRYYPETDNLVMVGGGWSYDGRFIRDTLYIPDAILYEAAHTGTIVAVEDIASSAYLKGAREDTLPLSYASVMAIPVKHGADVQEVLCVTCEKAQHYTNNDFNSMELLASQVAGHLENARLYERVLTASSRMRAILDSTREGIILLDPAGRVIDANATAESLLNIDIEDHIGQNFVEFLVTHVSDATADNQNPITQDALIDMARILRSEPERITRRSLEVIRDGKPCYIEEVGSPVTNERGHILGRLLTLRDVTEERLLEAYRNEITSMVVHDLRGPLGSIISSHILMQEIAEELGDPTLPTIVEVSLESATSLMDLVESLLDVAKLETRQMPLKYTPIALIDLVNNAYNALKNSANHAGISIEIDIPEGLPDLFVDGDKIRRVIINVLDNAIRYTPSGKQVMIVARQQDARRVLVQISDSGPGIPIEERERVFEKFRQISNLSPVRGRKGMGLGLTFCKLTIEAHGQTIWIDNSSDLPGARFNFTLPLVGMSPPEPFAAVIEE